MSAVHSGQRPGSEMGQPVGCVPHPRTARRVPGLEPTRSWRVLVDVGGLDEKPLHALRVVLAADSFRRVAEDLEGGRVLVALVLRDSAETAALLAAAAALGIRDPALHTTSATEAVALLGGPPQVACEPVGRGLGVRSWPAATRVLPVGAVTGSRRAGAPALDVAALDHAEPLALRLALLRFPWASPATLSPARLHRADQTLQRWRFKVAGWKDMPPGCSVADGLDAVREALVEGLDTCAALTLLHRLEADLRLDSGRKFETFVDLDRVLALDLTRLVGMPRGYWPAGGSRQAFHYGRSDGVPIKCAQRSRDR